MPGTAALACAVLVEEELGGRLPPDVAGVVAAWEALVARADLPLAWRRQPGLLVALLRRAGCDPARCPPDVLARARRHRLRTLPPPPSPATAAAGGGAGAAAWREVARLAGGAPPPPARAWAAACVDAGGAALCADAGVVAPADVAPWLRALDGPAVRRAVRAAARRHGWNATTHDGVRAALLRACGHPDVDPDGRFQGHRHAVAADVLATHPALWAWPVEAARFVGRVAARDAADAAHLVVFLQDVVRRRLVRLPAQRDPARARAALCRRALWVLRLLWDGRPAALRAGGSAATWRDDVLPATVDRRGLLERAAWALGHHQRRGGGRRRRARATPSDTDPRRVLCGFWRGCVATGVFEPRIPATAAAGVLAPHLLDARLLALEAAEPGRYRAEPPALRLVDRPDPTPADVAALEAACRTARERAYLALLTTTGVRTCAVAWARVGDVWDAARGEVRPQVRLREKNGDVRTLTPVPGLRAALRAYVLEERGDRGGGDAAALLFPSRRRPRVPAPHVGRALLRTLCRRAGLARVFTPHLFRHYVVPRRSPDLRAGTAWRRTSSCGRATGWSA